MRTLLLRTTCLLLLVMGLAVSGYLLLRHFEVAYGAAAGADFCSAVFGSGCDAALSDPLSVQFGLPLAGWGVVLYGSLISLLLLGWAVGDGFAFEATLGALVASLVASLLSMVLLVSMLSGQTPVCPLCIVVHAVNLFLLVPLKMSTGRSIAGLARSLAAVGRYLLGGTTTTAERARWRVVGFLASALVGVVLYQWVYVEGVLHAELKARSEDPAETVASFESRTPQDVGWDKGDPQLGPVNAPIHLVVFSDFQCPGCRAFARTLASLRRRFADHLHVVFKHYPLSNRCNPLVETDLHPAACTTARAAEAAHAQGRFWAFYDAMFATRLSSAEESSVEHAARQAGLNLEQFETDRTGAEVRRNVQDDVEQGVALGLDGTPAVLLNGRRVYDTRLKTLELLISHELEHHGVFSDDQHDSHDLTAR